MSHIASVSQNELNSVYLHTYYIINIFGMVFRGVRLFIFIVCLSIVAWQCFKCIQKYLENPQGTSLSVVNSAGKMFPSITVCPDAFNKTSVLNSTSLSECGLNSDDYLWDCLWSVKGINDECADPKQLFEKITFKPEDILIMVKVSLFNQNQYSKVTIWPNETGM